MRLGHVLWWVLAVTPAFGEQLPLRTYSTVHGLAANSVHRIRNAGGLLWFATTEGLSRFDGVHFINYGTAEGLPHSNVHDFIGASDGTYWVATERGLCRYDPKPEAGETRFTEYPLDGRTGRRAFVLLDDREGNIWCGTADGLYRRTRGETRFRSVDLGPRSEAWSLPDVTALHCTRTGTVWIGSGGGLYRAGRSGKLDRFTKAGNGLPRDEILAIAEDRSGELWVGTDLGLSRLVPDPAPGGPIVDRHFSKKDGLPDEYVQSLLLHSSGRLWAGTLHGFVEVVQQGSGSAILRTFTSDEGLATLNAEALAEDSAGNIWIGTDGGGGAMKFALTGITNYTTSDGLGSLPVISIFESREGRLCAVTRSGSDMHLNWFDGTRFHALRPAFPPSVTSFGGGRGRIALQGRSGDWWFGTGSGLVRFTGADTPAGLAYARPQAVYTRLDAVESEHVHRIFEDSRGNVWGTGSSKFANAVFRIHNGVLERFDEQDGLPSLKGNLVDAIAEDRYGQIWLGYHDTGLVRYRKRRFGRIAGLPEGGVRVLLADRAGRLWAAVEAAGLARTDRPDDEHPVWMLYTKENGLSSNTIYCLAEDNAGRIYLGTGHGVDSLDPASGRVRPYTAADGLLEGEARESWRDRSGALWFATHKGLSRLQPQAEARGRSPEVFLTRVSVSGTPFPISDLGETNVAGLELEAGAGMLEVQFGGRDFSPARRLLYRHKLDGAGAGWGMPSESGALQLAGLSPGSYRLLVQVLAPDGQVSEPASIRFTVIPPVWRRWWFLLLAAASACGLAYAIHRNRLMQAVALERLRIRIASDLHDDIGSNLSVIAGISEVLRQNAGTADVQLNERLSAITSVSNRSMDAMSDIVWAIDPRKDHMRDLAQRMRRWAGDALSGRAIRLLFNAGPDGPKVNAEIRREVFLMFKEAVHNAVRHSGCTEVAVRLSTDGAELVLEVRDNGRGITPGRAPEGYGISSIRSRARRLGGEAWITSAGSGTDVAVRVPLREKPMLFRRSASDPSVITSAPRDALRDRAPAAGSVRKADRRGPSGPQAQGDRFAP